MKLYSKFPKVKTEIYNYKNISKLVWPNDYRSEQIKKLFLPIMRDGIERYVKNIKTDINILKVSNHVFPIAIQNCKNSDSLILSPSTLYFDVAKLVVDDYKKYFLRKACQLSLGIANPIFKTCKFDKVVYVNGWPFSTTLYPNISNNEIEAIRISLVNHFPHHTIVFRTIDSLVYKNFENKFISLGFKLIYARPIYSMFPANDNFKLSASLKKDIRQLKKTSYEIISNEEIDEKMCQRLYILYRKLYIEKHSPYNPDYTENFFRLLIRKRVMPIIALRKNGIIDGFLGILENEKIMTSPFLGYDLNAPKELALYRILETLLYIRAKQKKVVLNNSAGVGYFKLSRGNSLSMEYFAVYDEHLPLFRRIPWYLLHKANRIAIPLLMKYNY